MLYLIITYVLVGALLHLAVSFYDDEMTPEVQGDFTFAAYCWPLVVLSGLSILFVLLTMIFLLGVPELYRKVRYGY